MTTAVGLRAIVTDLDGVLCDTETLFARAVNALLAEEGLPPLTFLEARSLVGLDNDSYWVGLQARRPQLRLSLKEYTARVDPLCTWYLTRQLVLAPGVQRLLNTARGRGLPLALASSGDRPYVELRLRLLDLTDAFDAVITRSEVRNPKPHPDLYLAATAALGVAPPQALALEDAPVGIRAARAAGCYTVAVRTPWTAGLELGEAHQVVGSLEELELERLGVMGTQWERDGSKALGPDDRDSLMR